MNLRHKFGKDWLLEVGYVGSHRPNLSKWWNIILTENEKREIQFGLRMLF